MIKLVFKLCINKLFFASLSNRFKYVWGSDCQKPQPVCIFRWSPRPIAHNARVTSSKTRNDQNHIKRVEPLDQNFWVRKETEKRCFRVFSGTILLGYVSSSFWSHGRLARASRKNVKKRPKARSTYPPGARRATWPGRVVQGLLVELFIEISIFGFYLSNTLDFVSRGSFLPLR